MSTKTPIARAVELAGGITKLARVVGAKKGAVWAWVNRGQCPAEWALAVANATDGQISVHELRPDVFGKTPVTGEAGAPPVPAEPEVRAA